MCRDYNYTSSVTAMLKDLSWRSLDQGRINGRLVMLYKVTYDLVAIPASQYLTRNTRLSRYIHALSYRQIRTLKDYCRFTYFPRTTIDWNALPAHIPVLPILAQFSCAVCQVIHVSPKTPAPVLTILTLSILERRRSRVVRRLGYGAESRRKV